MEKPVFTYTYLKNQFEAVLKNGYTVLRCEDYVHCKKESAGKKLLINRVDVDFSVKKAGELCRIFDSLNIKATFFIRLHAPEYNPFSFENYRLLKYILESGHEIGYHSEIVDQAMIWNEDAAVCLRRDIDLLNLMLGIEIQGVASHGGMTGLNNLDFWKDKKASDYGLLYEAYDNEKFDLFNNSLYVSDSEWTRWKCYQNGKRVENDHRSLAEHTASGHPLIYSLIHPDTYFHQHFYDNEK